MRKIKVGGINYQVVEKPFIEVDGDKNMLGSCSCENSTIEILESMNEERKEQVLAHELTHAIFLEAGYDFADQDEDMVNRVGNVLHQVLKDNFIEKESQHKLNSDKDIVEINGERVEGKIITDETVRSFDSPYGERVLCIRSSLPIKV